MAAVRLPVLLQSNPQRLAPDGPITPTETIAQTDVRSAATAAAVEQAEQVVLDLTQQALVVVVHRHLMPPMLRCRTQKNQALAGPSSRLQAHRFGLHQALRGRSN